MIEHIFKDSSGDLIYAGHTLKTKEIDGKVVTVSVDIHYKRTEPLIPQRSSTS